MQTDISNAPVNRPVCIETIPIGAAYLAGLAVGYWKSTADIKNNWVMDRSFSPNISKEDRAFKIKMWKKAVTCALHWAKEN